MKPILRFPRSSAMVVLALLLLPTLLILSPPSTAEEGPSGPWTLPVRVDSGPKATRSIESVRLAVGADGTIFAGWLEDRSDGNDCFVAASTDGGLEWGQDIRVDPFPNAPRPTPTTCGLATDDEDHVVAAYTQRTVQGWRVRFARSDNDGESFRSPSNAYDLGGVDDVQEHPALASSERGSFYILLLLRTQESSRLMMVRSDDGLNPVGPREVEPDMPTGTAHVQGEIAIGQDGTVYVAFGYVATTESGIKLARMAPTASTFEVGKVMSVPGDAPRYFRPRIAVSSDDVVEIVYDPMETESRLRHVRSEDGGATFSSPAVVWAAGETGDEQHEPAIAFDVLGRVHVAWAQGGLGPSRVYHSYSADGTTFTRPTQPVGAWNASEMGQREWESTPAIVAFPDGSMLAIYSAKLNNTVGVFASRLDNLPPVVSITYPPDGGQVRGLVSVGGTARDQGGTSGLSAVFVQVGDASPVRLAGETVWQHDFDSAVLPDGFINITAWASDGFLVGPNASLRVDVDNNLPPGFSIGAPANGSVHSGRVRVAGTAYDPGGLMSGWTAQWRLEDTSWADAPTQVKLDDYNFDYEVELDLSNMESGPVRIFVRVSDGDKFSDPQSVSIELENKPDLHVELDFLSWEPERPKHGQGVTFNLKVENRGVVASSKYEVELTRGSQAVSIATGSSLAAGHSETIVLQWDAHGGNNSFRLLVDSKYVVEELDELDNELRFNLIVKKPEASEGPSMLPYLLVVVVVVVILAGIGFVRWKVANLPDEVVDVYEGGGLYDETGGPSSGRDVRGEGGAGEGSSPGGSTGDGIGAKDMEPLEQDVTIREERVERA